MDDLLPAIQIEHFEVEQPRLRRRIQPVPRQNPVVEAFERLRCRYDAYFGAYLRFSPRRESRVERRVEVTVPLAFEYDPVEHEFRAPVTLKVPWSWPRLPVWFAVTEASRRQATVSVRLRSRKRWRYPVRYYPIAHDFLRTGRWGSGSPEGRALV
jgi:hypothetical protein